MFQPVQPATEILPNKAGNHSLIHHDNQLYLVGGVSRPDVFWKVWKFNLLTNTWKHIGKEYPQQFLVNQNSFPKAILFGNGLLIIYRVGGGRGFMFPFSGSHKFEHVPLTWSGDMPQMTQPTHYTLHALSIISCPDDSRRVYVFQPRSREGMNVVDVYTLTITDLIGHWEKLDVTGECRYRTTDIDEDVAAVLHDRRVYICNAPASDSGDFRKLHAFNLDTLSWETVLTTHSADGPWPLARHFHSIVLYNDIVYFVGGMTEDDEDFFDEILQLNLKTKKWDTKRNLSLSEKLGLSSATVTQDGCVYVFGGYNDRRLYSNQLQKLWLKPPPLKWIAFNKVKQMYASSSKGQINKSDPRALLAMGIPPDFVRTLQE